MTIFDCKFCTSCFAGTYTPGFLAVSPRILNPRSRIRHAEYRWNIFIPRMQDFAYAEDQEVVSNKFITVDLPQGPATVCLFQKNPQYANTSPMAIALMLNMDPSKMPAKPDELKYDYGTFVSVSPTHSNDLGATMAHL